MKIQEQPNNISSNRRQAKSPRAIRIFDSKQDLDTLHQAPSKQVACQPPGQADTASKVPNSIEECERLRALSANLQQMLKEEMETRESLQNDYDQLAEKKALIEQQYLSSKYNANKIVNQNVQKVKKDLADKMHTELLKIMQGFNLDTKALSLSLPAQQRVQTLMHDIISMHSRFLEVKPNKSKMRILSLDKLSVQEVEHFSDQTPSPSTLMMDSVMEHRQEEGFGEEKVLSMVQPSIVINEEAEMEDEYYGEIDDYSLLEVKIEKRKAYELAKQRIEVRRKKIFDKPPQESP